MVYIWSYTGRCVLPQGGGVVFCLLDVVGACWLGVFPVCLLVWGIVRSLLVLGTFVLGGGGGCSDRTILYIYISDIVVGDCILCARPIADSGPGRLATSCCRRGRLPPDGWSPLAVAGGS